MDVKARHLPRVARLRHLVVSGTDVGRAGGWPFGFPDGGAAVSSTDDRLPERFIPEQEAPEETVFIASPAWMTFAFRLGGRRMPLRHSLCKAYARPSVRRSPSICFP
jgi:hypothetical protein